MSWPRNALLTKKLPCKWLRPVSLHVHADQMLRPAETQYSTGTINQQQITHNSNFPHYSNIAHCCFTDLLRRFMKSTRLSSHYKPNCARLRMHSSTCCAPRLPWNRTCLSRTTLSSLTGRSAWECARPSPCLHESPHTRQTNSTTNAKHMRTFCLIFFSFISIIMVVAIRFLCIIFLFVME